MTHLVDSDWVIDYLKRVSPAIDVLPPLVRTAEVAIPFVVYAEVLEGLLEPRAAQAARPAFEAFVKGVTVLGVDVPVADRFAHLRYDLRTTGRLIPDHDLWIAATALAHNLTLCTNDAHFRRIPGLKLCEPSRPS